MLPDVGHPVRAEDHPVDGPAPEGPVGHGVALAEAGLGVGGALGVERVDGPFDSLALTKRGGLDHGASVRPVHHDPHLVAGVHLVEQQVERPLGQLQPVLAPHRPRDVDHEGQDRGLPVAGVHLAPLEPHPHQGEPGPEGGGRRLEVDREGAVLRGRPRPVGEEVPKRRRVVVAEGVHELLHPDGIRRGKLAPLQVGPRHGVRGVVHVHREGGVAVVLGVHEGVHPVVLEEHGVEGLAVHRVGAAHRNRPAAVGEWLHPRQGTVRGKLGDIELNLTGPSPAEVLPVRIARRSRLERGGLLELLRGHGSQGVPFGGAGGSCLLPSEILRAHHHRFHGGDHGLHQGELHADLAAPGHGHRPILGRIAQEADPEGDVAGGHLLDRELAVRVGHGAEIDPQDHHVGELQGLTLVGRDPAANGAGPDPRGGTGLGSGAPRAHRSRRRSRQPAGLLHETARGSGPGVVVRQVAHPEPGLLRLGRRLLSPLVPGRAGGRGRRVVHPRDLRLHRPGRTDLLAAVGGHGHAGPRLIAFLRRGGNAASGARGRPGLLRRVRAPGAPARFRLRTRRLDS